MKTLVMCFVTDPTASAGVDVRCIGMSRLVMKILVLLRRRIVLGGVPFGSTCSGRRAVRRNVAMTDASTAVLFGMASAMFVVLTARLRRLQEERNRKS